jgi:hypothetical protein
MSRAVILVEGESDKAALETLAGRLGHDLSADGVTVVAMGGATNVGRYLEQHAGTGVALAGLCDAGEEGDFRRGLDRIGLGSNLTRGGLESLGFFVCEPDLEAEMIRALGTAAVEGVLEAQGELASFRIMQRQPAQRGRPVEDQLRRFLGTRSGRKVAYGRLLAEAVDLGRVPRPLRAVLAFVAP